MRKKNEKLAIRWARDRMQEDFVIVDTETNGWGDGFVSEVIQIGIVSKSGEVLLDALVRPTENVVQQQATDIHGLQADDLKGAPSFTALWPSIAEILQAHECTIAYNAAFDRQRLLDDVKRLGLPGEALEPKWRCAMLAYAHYHGDWNGYHKNWKWKKLDVAVKAFGIDIPRESHDATLDARLTLEVVKALAAVED